MSLTRAIFGCSSLALNADEVSFFREAKPWGFILFKRNIETPEQVKALCNSLRSLTGRNNTPILIDQEGGRVQRMRPPHWDQYLSAERFAILYNKHPLLGREVARLNAFLIGKDLRNVGINVNCAPVLDVRSKDANAAVIGDRSFGEDPYTVSTLGRAVAEGLLASSVLPVIKHMPGHGRAKVDSHETLPVVDASQSELTHCDFLPFRTLSDMPAAIPAHVIYTCLDPNNAGTISPVIIREVIRNELNYKGLLITDDLSMNALAGSLRERTERALEAGCDIALHCNGNLLEMEDVAKASRPLTGEHAQRAALALQRIDHVPEHVDLDWVRFQIQQSFSLNGVFA